MATKLKLADLDYTEIIHETDGAILFSIDGDEVWIPRSLLELDESTHTVTVPEWFALKEGLI
jgi:hypothetical protein